MARAAGAWLGGGSTGPPTSKSKAAGPCNHPSAQSRAAKPHVRRSFPLGFLLLPCVVQPAQQVAVKVLSVDTDDIYEAFMKEVALSACFR